MSIKLKTDQLERIADALDGGGDYNQGKPDEVGYLTRIANYVEENGPGGGGSGGESNVFIVNFYVESTDSSTHDVTCDTTIANIIEEYKSGKVVIGKFAWNEAKSSGVPEQYYTYWDCIASVNAKLPMVTFRSIIGGQYSATTPIRYMSCNSNFLEESWAFTYGTITTS